MQSISISSKHSCPSGLYCNWFGYIRVSQSEVEQGGSCLCHPGKKISYCTLSCWLVCRLLALLIPNLYSIICSWNDQIAPQGWWSFIRSNPLLNWGCSSAKYCSTAAHVCLFNMKLCKNKVVFGENVELGASFTHRLVVQGVIEDWSGRWCVYLKLFPSNTELRGRPAVSTHCFLTECQPNDGENYPRWCWGWITERPKQSQVGTSKNIFKNTLYECIVSQKCFSASVFRCSFVYMRM